MGLCIEVVRPMGEVVFPATQEEADRLLHLVERAGRVCYKSEHKISVVSAFKFVRNVVASGHLSVVEHANVTAHVICSRACSHQIVRHRLAAYSQESQRYCDYAGAKAGAGLQVVCPPTVVNIPPGCYAEHGLGNWTFRKSDGPRGSPWENAHLMMVNLGLDMDSNRACSWLGHVLEAYRSYVNFRNSGVPAEDARFLLPNATKTELYWTQNLRQWLHVAQERTLNPHAQWEIRQVTSDIIRQLCYLFPCVFDASLLEQLPPK